MKFFIDSADVNEIKKAREMGLVDGVTTNPSLIAKTGKPFDDVIVEIFSIVDGPVSVEAMGSHSTEIIEEARKYSKFGKNLVVKIPITSDGMKAVKILSSLGIKTNVTLLFSPTQALLAAKAGATYISPFVGRLDDNSMHGIDIVSDILNIYENYGFNTEVIVASIRNPLHVLDAALMGAHIATIPYSVMLQLYNHPLTDAGIKKFNEDWKKIPSK